MAAQVLASGLPLYGNNEPQKMIIIIYNPNNNMLLDKNEFIFKKWNFKNLGSRKSKGISNMRRILLVPGFTTSWYGSL